jgi:hypothetical protein
MAALPVKYRCQKCGVRTTTLLLHQAHVCFAPSTEVLIESDTKLEPDVNDELFSKNYKFTAAIGDLDHKKFVYQFFGSTSDKVVRDLITNRNQALYLQKFNPGLIPLLDEPGTKLNDHSMGTVFEYRYATDKRFVTEYMMYIMALRHTMISKKYTDPFM